MSIKLRRGIAIAMLVVGALYGAWWMSVRQEFRTLVTTAPTPDFFDRKPSLNLAMKVLGVDLRGEVENPASAAKPAQIAEKISRGINLHTGLGGLVMLSGFVLLLVPGRGSRNGGGS